MCGEMDLRPQELTRLIEYVQDGGTLIANSAYLKQLNEETNLRGINRPFSAGLGYTVSVVPFDDAGGAEVGGHFVIYGPSYDTSLIRPILRELIPHLSPFHLTTSGPAGSKHGPCGALVNIEYLLNRNSGGWVLTLINNDGVTKDPFESPETDEKQTKYIHIELNQEFIQKTMPGSVLNEVLSWSHQTPLWNRDELSNSFERVELTIAPGDLVVLEFKFEA